MTIDDIQKVLNSSFKNGFYIRRPHFIDLDIEVYIDKNGKTWQFMDDLVFSIDLMQHERQCTDWEIIL